jgi:quinone-modifying oxidoreductase subunit QmoB
MPPVPPSRPSSAWNRSTAACAVHPRSGDMTFPDFFFQRCTQCKRCTEECPFGALDDDEKGNAQTQSQRAAAAAVPAWGPVPSASSGLPTTTSTASVPWLNPVVRCRLKTTMMNRRFRILGLVCENDAYPALDMWLSTACPTRPTSVSFPVRCLGSVNVIWIKDALSQGMDGVFLLGCKHGDDYQCHFVKGSELADIRMKKIGDALASLALEEERVAQFEVAIDEYDKLPKIINDFVESRRRPGTEPLQGLLITTV